MEKRLRNEPLLRSKNESKYRIETAGKSLKSSFLSRLFSFTAPCAMPSKSESELVDAPGLSTSTFSESMLPEAAD
jgi:hypothetical protein